jgi:hypothetical protein
MNLHHLSISPVDRAQALEATEVWGRKSRDPVLTVAQTRGLGERHTLVASHVRVREVDGVRPSSQFNPRDDARHG